MSGPDFRGASPPKVIRSTALRSRRLGSCSNPPHFPPGESAAPVAAIVSALRSGNALRCAHRVPVARPPRRRQKGPRFFPVASGARKHREWLHAFRAQATCLFRPVEPMSRQRAPSGAGFLHTRSPCARSTSWCGRISRSWNASLRGQPRRFDPNSRPRCL